MADKASSNAVVLEELVVKMLGDNSDYKSMLKDTEASSVSTANKIIEAGKLIETVGVKFANLMKSFGLDRDTAVAKAAKEAEFRLKERTDELDALFREGSIKNMDEYKAAYKDLELKYGAAVEKAKKDSEGLTSSINYLTAAAGKMAASLADLVPWLSLAGTTMVALNTELFKTAWASFTASTKGAITYLTTFSGVTRATTLSMKAMLGVAGLISGAVVGIGYAILEASKSLSGFNRELSRTSYLSTVFDEYAGKRAKRIIEDAGKEETTVKEREQLRLGRAGINEETESRAKDLRKLEHELSNLDEGYNFDILDTLDRRRQGDILRAKIAAIKQEMESLRKAAETVGARIEAIGNPFDDLEEEIKKINKEVENLGKNSHEIRLGELSEEGVGLSESNLQRLRDAIEEQKEAVKARKLNEDIKETTKHLKEQAEAYGLGAEQARIQRLEAQGATKEQLAEARTAAEYLQGLRHREELMNRGKALEAQYATQEEKRLKTQKELDELLFNQAISQETYNRALADTGKKHHDVEMAARNAATAGSAEARSRIFEFQSRTTINPLESGINGKTSQEYLRQIAENTGSQARRPAVEIQPSDLN